MSRTIVIMAAVVGILVGVPLGIAFDRTFLSSAKPETDATYTPLRNELLRELPSGWRYIIMEKVDKHVPKWPEAIPLIERLLNDDVPQLQFAGLYALIPHKNECPPRLFEKAKQLSVSKTRAVKIAALYFLRPEEQKSELIALANSLLESQSHVGRRMSRFSDDFLEITRGLEAFPSEEVDDVFFRIFATGDWLALTGNTRVYLTKKPNRKALKYVPNYLRDLLDIQREETFLVLDWIEYHSGNKLPKGLVYANLFRWYGRIVDSITEWFRKNPDVIDPTKPLPPLKLPESLFIHDYEPKLPD